MLEYGVSIFLKAFSGWRLPKRQFPMKQLPNVKIPKRQLPKGCERPSEAQQSLMGGGRGLRLGQNSEVVLGKSHSWEVAAWEITWLGSFRLGNHTVGKLALGKSHS